MYIISNGEGEYWCNEDKSWGDRVTATRFSDKELRITMPEGGFWTRD